YLRVPYFSEGGCCGGHGGRGCLESLERLGRVYGSAASGEFAHEGGRGFFFRQRVLQRAPRVPRAPAPPHPPTIPAPPSLTDSRYCWRRPLENPARSATSIR